ncbi:Bestrophin, RFP-TM, chloride channel-domain-containing protein [Melampsora americana]|nr:Bestrophin, RFP-TM, chloride channel-domain-containing protein [Melampsora americana]
MTSFIHHQTSNSTYSPFHEKREIEREQILLNPFRSPSTLLFFRAITLWAIWPSIAFFTAWATLVILIDRDVTSLQLPPTLLTVLGTVIGFVVSYRTSSAYERYNDGRKQWSSIILAARTFARLIWLHCPNAPRPFDSNNPPTEEERLRSIIEKKTMINLIEGFAVSLKHYLRGEHGIYYEDLYRTVKEFYGISDLACFLPKYAPPAERSLDGHDLNFNVRRTPDDKPIEKDNANGECNGTIDTPQTASTLFESVNHPNSERVKDKNTSRAQELRPHTNKYLNPFKPDRELLPAYNPPKSNFVELFPIWSMFRALWKGTRNVTGLRLRKGTYSRVIHDDNIPLEILWYIDSYVAKLQLSKVIDVPTINSLLASILTMSDASTNLDRILTTPIPYGYIVHLKLVIWGYLTFLPFQLIHTFGFCTIPATALVSIAFLGFMRVGEEIENPFGYYFNDLDMDYFCHHLIAPELSKITAWPLPDPTEFIFSPSNVPLLDNHDLRSAVDLLNSNLTVDHLQILLRTCQSSINPVKTV